MNLLPYDDNWKNQPCRLRTVNVNAKGYSKVAVDGTEVMYHRFIWEMLNGPVPVNSEICHKCNIRNCFEITHLYAGTHQANITQATLEGRMAKKLTTEIVIRIKSLLKEKPQNLTDNQYDKELAYHFGVSKMSISKLRRGLVWKHIP